MTGPFAKATAQESPSWPVLIENPKLRIEYDLQGALLQLRPVGVIDEDSNLGKLVAAVQGLFPKPAEVRFDLGHITRLNSCGVREWLSFITRFKGLYKLSYVNVSELMVEQSSMIAGILGGPDVNVISIQMPYFCEKCDARSYTLLENPKAWVLANGAAPHLAQNCKTCRGPLEFDGLEEQYFSIFKA